ncbi:phage tail protein I [Foetidibacter luteolus]|uniref:phage tail protein I n=1 Tax=Foetidibacter luteolus TaxID=2608880 RepID=UPI00129C0AC8|nr:phage tail protein I [Foetidibacter luteolus]
MNKNGSVLADSIAHVKHLAAFDLLVKKRYSELELDKLLVYVIDTVDAGAIPYLAEQFDVLGYKGFRLATTEAEKRNIIKKSIELHRFKGTLWAVREALQGIGFGDIEITEHVDDHWAKFRATIDLGEKSLNIQEMQDIVKMIYEYKNARSHLVDVTYTISITEDKLTITDDFSDAQATDDADAITIGGNNLHDGLRLRNGSINYGPDSDVLTIQIV